MSTTRSITVSLTKVSVNRLIAKAAAARYGHSRLSGAGWVWDSVPVGEAAARAALEAIGISLDSPATPVSLSSS